MSISGAKASWRTSCLGVRRSTGLASLVAGGVGYVATVDEYLSLHGHVHSISSRTQLEQRGYISLHCKHTWRQQPSFIIHHQSSTVNPHGYRATRPPFAITNAVPSWEGRGGKPTLVWRCLHWKQPFRDFRWDFRLAARCSVEDAGLAIIVNVLYFYCTKYGGRLSVCTVLYNREIDWAARG